MLVTPSELEEDRIKSTTGLMTGGSSPAPEEVGFSVLYLSSVNFGKIFLSRAGSLEDGGMNDVFAVNFFGSGHSGVRWSSEVVVLSCTLGRLALLCAACFEELCLLCDFEFVSFGMSALNLRVSDVRLLLRDASSIWFP